MHPEAAPLQAFIEMVRASEAIIAARIKRKHSKPHPGICPSGVL
jgi:hypothetical protein